MTLANNLAGMRSLAVEWLQRLTMDPGICRLSMFERQEWLCRVAKRRGATCSLNEIILSICPIDLCEVLCSNISAYKTCHSSSSYSFLCTVHFYMCIHGGASFVGIFMALSCRLLLKMIPQFSWTNPNQLVAWRRLLCWTYLLKCTRSEEIQNECILSMLIVFII